MDKYCIILFFKFSCLRHASSKVVPVRIKVSHYPPNLYTFLILSFGVVEGMKIVPLIFNCLQQYAIPCAWFPALAVTTPLYLY